MHRDVEKSPYTAPAFRPLPSFGGKIVERLERSQPARDVMNKIVQEKIKNSKVVFGKKYA
jgi:hypothetical protein